MKRVLCILGKQVSEIGYYAGNSGNYLFNYALESYLTNDKAEVSYMHSFPDNYDFVNENFDIILYSSANFINYKTKKWLPFLALQISKIKIPVFFIGIGLQADLNDEKLTFLRNIKREASVFLDAVYKTGGSFALRGNKTAEAFEKLGYRDYTVTGCPSLFMQGRNLKILPRKIKKNELSPLINGTSCLLDKKINHCFSEYPKSIFIDQDRFYKILNKKECHPIKYADIFLWMRFGNSYKLLEKNRIKLFTDIPLWMNFIKTNKFNFSFGSRIHGNLISILCDIPSLIFAKDMRVLELAQFFEIPYLTHIPQKTDLYTLYQTLDYEKFNLNFSQKFDNFQNFFNKHDIPCIAGKNNKFEEKLKPLF